MARRAAEPTVMAMRLAEVKSLLVTGSDPKWVIDWLQTETPGDEAAGIPAKLWKVGRQHARGLVNRALEELGDADALSKDRKRARNRGLHTMIVQKLLKVGTVEALRVALKAADQLCKIDGSYDPASLGGPTAGLPASEEEAGELIDHAAATLELARQRQRLPPPARPAVIDVDPEPDAEASAEGGAAEPAPHAN